MPMFRPASSGLDHALVACDFTQICASSRRVPIHDQGIKFVSQILLQSKFNPITDCLVAEREADNGRPSAQPSPTHAQGFLHGRLNQSRLSDDGALRRRRHQGRTELVATSTGP